MRHVVPICLLESRGALHEPFLFTVLKRIKFAVVVLRALLCALAASPPPPPAGSNSTVDVPP